MSIFSYHLLNTSYLSGILLTIFPPKPQEIPGLIHVECMSAMTLGSPVFSTSRILIRKVALFAQWEDQEALDNYLNLNKSGKKFARGWHVRLVFLRQWGQISGFQISDADTQSNTIDTKVVAITLARMKFLQIPRFIRWGRPVEKMVHDHPGTKLALASIRLPNLVSTFSIWESQKEMTDMVWGHSHLPNPTRHLNAMKERDRKDFHFEFTTLRFQPIAEFGEWKGKTHISSDEKL